MWLPSCSARLAELKQLRVIGMFCAGVLMVQDTLRRITVDDSENVPLFPKLEFLCMHYEIMKLRDSVTAVAARSLCASRREACVRRGIAIAKLDDVDIDILGEDELPAVLYNRYLLMYGLLVCQRLLLYIMDQCCCLR